MSRRTQPQSAGQPGGIRSDHCIKLQGDIFVHTPVDKGYV